MNIKTQILVFFLSFLSLHSVKPEWGFFGHRKINRLAVFTLDEDLFPFYKYHIEYITAHAVDPDKRRYATKHEAVRHYIDIDHWGDEPFDVIPKEFAHAFFKYAKLFSISENFDTTEIKNEIYHNLNFIDSKMGQNLKKLFYNDIDAKRFEDEIAIDCSTLENYINIPYDCSKVLVIDEFSQYGILPYFLPRYYRKLVKAFEEKNPKRILQLSADIGHYIGDAHVPLHTTENYNGQLTDQIGIHAFWESRLPELFAEEQYDFFVGKAEYIPNINTFIWNIIQESHELLNDVLLFEKELSSSFPTDQQFCFEERLEITIRTQCKEYSEAYHTKLDGMVERRMQASIHAIGSVWLSAWIDAGQPDIRKLLEIDWKNSDEETKKELESLFNSGKIKGRNHDN